MRHQDSVGQIMSKSKYLEPKNRICDWYYPDTQRIEILEPFSRFICLIKQYLSESSY